MRASASVDPAVTVLITSYNYGPLIERAVDSALHQTAPRELYEIVVVDDGSTDDTLGRLASYGDKIRIVRLPHGGLPAACNAGLSATRGEFFVRLDADDELEPNAVAALFGASALLSADDAVVCPDLTEVFADGGSRYRAISPDNIYSMEAISLLFRTEAVRLVGGYREFFWEEHDLMIRLRQRYGARHLPCSVYRYFKHAASMTARQDARLRGWQQLVAEWGPTELRKWGACPELPAGAPT